LRHAMNLRFDKLIERLDQRIDLMEPLARTHDSSSSRSS
jgi:hypothetical protein